MCRLMFCNASDDLDERKIFAVYGFSLKDEFQQGHPLGGRSAARQAVFRTPGRILARKSVFCYRTPDFVNGPFVTLCETVDLAPLDRFLNFSFPSYGPKWPFSEIPT